MSDKYIQINNFKYGLDTRREQLASVPGTLVTCQNALINAGGEVERRKAFVNQSLTSICFPTDTFGLEATEDGLVTFGSVVTPTSSWATLQVSRANNIGYVTVSTVSTNIAVGNTISIVGTTADGGSFNGNWVVSSVNGTHTVIGFAMTGAQLNSTSEAAGKVSVKLASWAVTYAERASGVGKLTVASITTSIAVGENIAVFGITNANFLTLNGWKTVTAVSITTETVISFTDSGTYAKTALAAGTLNRPATLPTGVTYQRLIPPPDATLTQLGAMTAVLFSCCFNGKSFVIATFTNSTRGFCYYDGAIVRDSVDGLVGALTATGGLTTNMATALVNEIQAALPDWIVSSAAGVVTLKCPVGVSYTPTFVKHSTNGTTSVLLLAAATAGTGGIAAGGAFTISGTISGTIEVTSSGGGGTAVSGGPVTITGAADADAAAVLVTNAINSYTPTTGYSAAKTTGAKVNVYAPVAAGATANTYNLIVDASAATITIVGVPISAIGISLSPTSIEVALIRTGTVSIIRSCTATPTGATGAVTYAWVECNADGSTPVSPASGMNLSGASTQTASFGKTMQVNTSCQAYFKVTTTDAGTGTSASATISVYYQVDSPV